MTKILKIKENCHFGSILFEFTYFIKIHKSLIRQQHNILNWKEHLIWYTNFCILFEIKKIQVWACRNNWKISWPSFIWTDKKNKMSWFHLKFNFQIFNNSITKSSKIGSKSICASARPIYQNLDFSRKCMSLLCR